MRDLLTYGLSFLSIFFVIHLGFVHYISKQAQNRGYSYWQWALGGLFSSSLILAVLLALLPDMSLEEKRRAKRELLSRKLKRRRELPVQPEIRGHMLQTSLGDMATFDPEKIAAMVSLGNHPTIDPRLQRSIGDEVTRMPAMDQSIGDQAARLPDLPIADTEPSGE